MPAVLMTVVFLSCGLKGSSLAEKPLPLIPWPTTVELSGCSISLAPAASIVTGDSGRTATELFSEIASSRWNAGFRIFRHRPSAKCGPGAIGTKAGECVSCSGSILLGEAIKACGREDELMSADLLEEGYLLMISDAVLLDSDGKKGYQHGFMTLLQLISTKGEGLRVPCVSISDHPFHEWRGLMLDSSRSFIPPDMVKRYLDYLAELKLNVFHWHLTDDQGWRIESKVFARLHTQGSDLDYLSDDKLDALKDYGWNLDRGYYTQEEVREIVAYAQERNIMIVPEIDIPGHSSAMLHAYPELSCSGEGAPLRTWTTIYPTALCPGKEEVYEFLDKLFAEVAGLFPGPYLHIGSDEVVGADWLDYPPNRDLMEKHGLSGRQGLQSYFVKRVNRILAGHGKTMIAWDETASYLPEDAVCQVWRKHEYAGKAARGGNRVIVSLFTPHYLNYSPFFHTMKSIYNFRHVPKGLETPLHDQVIGGEACIWGRQPTVNDMEPRSFPRMLAFAESVWTRPAARDWDQYLLRLNAVESRMKRRGIEFGRTWQDMKPKSRGE